MMARKKTSKKTSTKKKTGEALAKDAIATIDENIARLDGETTESKAPAKGRKSKKPATPRAKKAKATKPKEKAPKKVSGLDLAAKVLEASKEPLSAKEIADRVIRAGWKTDGKTPHATLYSAMLREMNTKKKEARFIKVDRGRFAFNPRTKAVSA